MTTVAARPPRAIPTVQVNPALLREGDIIYPDINRHRDTPFCVLRPAIRAHDEDGRPGWRVELERDRILWVPEGKKVCTQRRPNHQLLDPEVADRLAENYREPRYG